MKKQLLITLLITLSTLGFSQSIYDPAADAEQQIEQGIKKAKDQDKHVFVMIGGNWCPWCKRLNKFLTSNESVNKVLDDNYIMVKVNYSKENKNKKILSELGYPQRFGFPVLVILDEKGERIHTQSSVYLEEGKGYSEKRIKEFLKNWSPGALDPSNY